MCLTPATLWTVTFEMYNYVSDEGQDDCAAQLVSQGG